MMHAGLQAVLWEDKDMAERNLAFDDVINRRNTGSMKYDFAEKNGMPADVLPLWVADMDFRTSSYVEDALTARAKHAIFGYTEPQEGYFKAVHGWFERHHGWDVKEEWLLRTPGVVFAFSIAVQAYTQPGESVIIQNPVYYPFSNAVLNNGRKLVSSDLFLGEDNRYHIDFEDFEKKVKENNVRLFILCSPHNPVARVWTKEELEALGDICVKYGVVVMSDEIHQDFVFKGEHHCFAEIKDEFKEISVIATAPSKTFNLAGLALSNIFIPDKRLKKKYEERLYACGMFHLNAMGITACEAAYDYGDEWYKAMMAYVGANIEFIGEFVKNDLPGVTLIEHEGTYLPWLDFRGTGKSAEEIDDLMINKAKLWLDSGSMFGKCGAGFQRINVACPRITLEDAMQRMKKILE